MLDIFSEPPSGIQEAPHEVRLNAAGHQVALRAVKLNCVTDKHSLRTELAMGLSVPLEDTQNADTLLAYLTAPQMPPRFGILLLGYRDFRYRAARLSDTLDSILLEAQRRQAAQGKALYLLAAYAETNPTHF